MIDWFLNLVPWWVWAIIAVVVLAAAHRLLGGWRNMIAAAGVALGAILSLRGYQKGWEARTKKEDRDADKAIEKARKARADADARNADPDKLRQSDGHRRD